MAITEREDSMPEREQKLNHKADDLALNFVNEYNVPFATDSRKYRALVNVFFQLIADQRKACAKICDKRKERHQENGLAAKSKRGQVNHYLQGHEAAECARAIRAGTFHEAELVAIVESELAATPAEIERRARELVDGLDDGCGGVDDDLLVDRIVRFGMECGGRVEPATSQRETALAIFNYMRHDYPQEGVDAIGKIIEMMCGGGVGEQVVNEPTKNGILFSEDLY